MLSLRHLFSTALIIFGLSTVSSCDRLDPTNKNLDCDGGSIPFKESPIPNSSTGLSSPAVQTFNEFDSRPMKTAVTKNYIVHIRGFNQGVQDLAVLQRSDGKSVSIASSDKSLNDGQPARIYAAESMDGDRIVLLNNGKIQVVEIRSDGFKLVYEQTPDRQIRMMIPDGERVVFVSSNYGNDPGSAYSDPPGPKGIPVKHKPRKNCRSPNESAQSEDAPTSLDQQRAPTPPPPQTVVHVLDLNALRLDSSAVWEHSVDFENWNRTSKNLYLKVLTRPVCEPNRMCPQVIFISTWRFTTSPLQAPVEVKDRSEIINPEESFLAGPFESRFTRHIAGSKYRFCRSSESCAIVEIRRSPNPSGKDMLDLLGRPEFYIPMDGPFGDILPFGDGVLEASSSAYRLIDKALQVGEAKKWP